MKMKLVSKKRETHDTVTIRLQGEEKLNFKPGQFVMVEFLRDEKLPKRAYSISSSPEREYIELTVKSMAEGWISNLINSAEEGEEFEVQGPFGHFIFDSEKMKEIVMIGAGSGIAPFRCFMQYIIDKKLDTTCTFAYGNKTEDDIICHNELKEFGYKIPGMKAYYCLSREHKDGFVQGRIDDALVKEIVGLQNDAYYFLCGPPKMVQGTKELLERNGVLKERIKVEIYG